MRLAIAKHECVKSDDPFSEQGGGGVVGGGDAVEVVSHRAQLAPNLRHT